MKNQLALGHILALAVSAVWGTTYISTKVLLTAFHPVEILVFRFLLAWAVLFLCSPRPLLPKGFRQELPFVCCGLTGLTFYSILENYALEFSLASTVDPLIPTPWASCSPWRRPSAGADTACAWSGPRPAPA